MHQFYGRLENAFFLQEKPFFSIKFLVLGGGYFGFGGGGKCRFYFYGRADFFCPLVFLWRSVSISPCSEVMIHLGSWLHPGLLRPLNIFVSSELTCHGGTSSLMKKPTLGMASHPLARLRPSWPQSSNDVLVSPVSRKSAWINLGSTKGIEEECRQVWAWILVRKQPKILTN